MRKKGTLWPVCFAACFFLVSCVCYVRTYASAEKQAERWIRELYTVRRDLDFSDWTSEPPDQLYEKRFGSRLTGEGLRALLDCGLPYVILFQETEALVTRSHVTEVSLQEAEPEEAERLVQQKASNETQSFPYEVTVKVTLEKGDSVLAPASEQHYQGILTLEKASLFGWKLCDFKFY